MRDEYAFNHDFRQPKKQPPQLYKPVEVTQMMQLMGLLQDKNWSLTGVEFGWGDGRPFAHVTIQGIGVVVLAGDLYGRNKNVRDFVVVSVGDVPWASSTFSSSPEYAAFWQLAITRRPQTD